MSERQKRVMTGISALYLVEECVSFVKPDGQLSSKFTKELRRRSESASASRSYPVRGCERLGAQRIVRFFMKEMDGFRSLDMQPPCSFIVLLRLERICLVCNFHAFSVHFPTAWREQIGRVERSWRRWKVSHAPHSRWLVRISRSDQLCLPSIRVGKLVPHLPGEDNALTCSLATASHCVGKIHLQIASATSRKSKMLPGTSKRDGITPSFTLLYFHGENISLL